MRTYIITRLGGGLGYTWSETDLRCLENALVHALLSEYFGDDMVAWANEKVAQLTRLREGRPAQKQSS